MAVKNIARFNACADVWAFGASDSNHNGMSLGSKTLGVSAVRQSDDMKPPRPVNGEFRFTLTSGTLTVKALTGSAAAPSDFSGATSSGAISDTTEHAVPFTTTTTNPLATFQLTAGGGGAVVASAHAVVYDELPAGTSYHESAYAFCALDPSKTSPSSYALTA